MRSQQGAYRHNICLRLAYKLLLPAEVSGCGARNLGNNTRFFGRLLPIIYLGGLFMKVVLFKSPKLLSGILRIVFGIKKQSV